MLGQKVHTYLFIHSKHHFVQNGLPDDAYSRDKAYLCIVIRKKYMKIIPNFKNTDVMKFNYLTAIILAAGIALGGHFIYQGISKYSDKDRCVNVKGLSECEMLANHVTWPMSVSLEGNDLNALLRELKTKKDDLVNFLVQNGMVMDEITISSPSINDRSEYSDYKKNRPRYNVSLNVTVDTRKVKEVLDIMNQQSDLMAKGMNISTNDYSVQYDYLDLTELKPKMVEEATKDARKVAQKFAEDAGCELGSIRSATQGQFTVENQYYRPQYMQIRVVTNVSYYLK